MRLKWLLFFLAYILLYPLVYFRHDDWLILGNAVFHLVPDWKFAFSPSLFYGEHESGWFFRPGFKTIVLVFYRLFGYHYPLWLGTLLATTVLGLYLGARSVERLGNCSSRAELFLAGFLASIPFHLGSLLWAGEGMMNCPQFLLISLSIYCFVRFAPGASSRSRQFGLAGAFLAFVIALGFKESGVVHPFFIACLLWCERRWHGKSIKESIFLLLPYALFTPLYLWVRLLKMPLNVHYLPVFDVISIAKPLAFTLAGPALLLLAWLVLAEGKFATKSRTITRALFQKWPFFFFFGVSIAPYLGHGFFSSGWLMLPGFYFLIFLAILVPSFQWHPLNVRRFAMVVVVANLIPVLVTMQSIGWWKWHRPQRQIKEIVEKASDHTKEIIIFKCANPEYSKSRFERVVAFEASLYYLWALHHTNPVPVKIHPCDRDYPHLAREARDSGDKLVLRWRFPEITVLPPTEVKDLS